MKILRYGVGMFVLLVLSACNSWLDVKPEDRITDKDLFKDREGFLKALNGIYVELTDETLYGENLSVGLLDVMGQYYNTGYSAVSSEWYVYARYNYLDQKVKDRFDQIWQKMYQMIVNCNIIIEECEKKTGMLGERWEALIKGETLALRAMLHFDLLRLFGPVCSENRSGEKCMPYMTSSALETGVLLPADKIYEYLVADLSAAVRLLKESDPILTDGVNNVANVNGDNSLNYRQYRLNYFAVKALLARCELWFGNQGNALRVTKEILAEAHIGEDSIFPFVTYAAAVDPVTPDRMFSTEVIFALYDIHRSDLYDALFTPTQASSKLLTFAGTLTSGRVNDLYDDKNDYRYKIWGVYTIDGEDILYHRKYADVVGEQAESFGYMVPLIRLSEIYLIAAECSENLQEATGYLNAVRNSRGCFSLFPADREELMNDIAAEFRKETLGEGQMFFFYKRRAMQRIPNGSHASADQDMNLNSYVVPLPESELKERSVNNL